jgi:integration host factor subunit alpha
MAVGGCSGGRLREIWGPLKMDGSKRTWKNAVTRADLCEAVYKKVALSRSESATLVELVLKEITDCLEIGETVKLSSFGSFVVRSRGPRRGRNPKTGKEVSIAPRRVMVFKPSAILKQHLARAYKEID